MPTKKNSKQTPQKKETSKTTVANLSGIENLVIIEWWDITSWSGWNHEILENGAAEPTLFTTVAFLVELTDEKLVTSDTYNDIGNLTVYPRGCIKEIYQIEI